MPLISFVIPTLNEELGILKTIEAIKKIERKLKKKGYVVEILVVDGGSKDKTREVAEELGARVILERRKGYGRAYKTGFSEAKGEILISLDGDNTYPVDEIPKLLEIFEKENLEFLTTNRFHNLGKGAMSLRNKIGNYILTFFTNLLFSLGIRDSQSGMWIISKEGWEKIKHAIKSDGMAFSQEIKIQAKLSGLKFKEVGISYKKRLESPKLSPWKDGIVNLMELFRKRLFG